MKTIIKRIKLIYFTNNILVIFETRINIGWDKILEKFENNNFPNENIDFLRGKDYIILEKKLDTIFRGTNQLMLVNEITHNKNSIFVEINVGYSRLNGIFFSIWKAGIFFITLILISALVFNQYVNNFKGNLLHVLLFTFILNLICWLDIHFRKKAAIAFYEYTLKIINT